MLDVQDLDAILIAKERTKQLREVANCEKMKVEQENARAEQELYKSKRDKNAVKQERERTKQMKLELEMRRQKQSELENAWLKDHPIVFVLFALLSIFIFLVALLY